MKQGLFWIICTSDKALDTDEFELLPHFETGVSHKNIWENRIKNERKDLRRFDFDHFPRGMVQIENLKVKVFLTPSAFTFNVMIKIAEIFEHMRVNMHEDLKYIDGNEDYKCFLDREQ